MASRYFATVRRATSIPRLPSSPEIAASDRGLRGSSSSTSFLIIARIAVADASPPSWVESPTEKKCLNSKVPRGVCRYLRVVMRETVDSCTPISSATCFSVSGRIASGP